MSDSYYLTQQQQQQQQDTARYQSGQSSHAMHTTAGIPIDPALSGIYNSFYPPPYDNQQRPPQQGHPQHQPPQHLPAMHSSPSDDSESIASPAAESSNVNGKRPAAAGAQNRKKQKKDDDGVSQSPGVEKEGTGKAKPTRGSRSVLSFLRLYIVHIYLV